MSSFIFLCGLTFKTKKIVLFWIEWLAAGRHYIWQQDNAPIIWQPDFLNLNPLDYSVWGVDEQITIEILCNTIDELKARITAEFTSLNNETIGKACCRFQSSFVVVTEKNGDFFG